MKQQNRFSLLHLAAVAALASAAVPALAAGVVATGNTQVNAAGATPVINIDAANAKGISHNTFEQFNVDRNGVVFNNLTAAGQSQLAGKLQANANLNGTAAKVIVADVNAKQASQLNGAIEVAGSGAHVLIANAAGISANGLTTINTPVLTLAAARFAPRADSDLALVAQTDNALAPATIRVDGAGIDVGAGQLNLLSRATLINAAVKGWEVAAHGGTEFEGDAAGHFNGKLVQNVNGVVPAFNAIDVSALGGMYANKITLEGSEKGLGVNNRGAIAAGQGGLAVELFNGRLQNNGLIGAEGHMYVVPAGVAQAGLTEQQAYEQNRAQMRDRAAAEAAAHNVAAMNDWNEAQKWAEVQWVQRHAFNPSLLSPTQQAAAEQAQAEQAAAEQARIEARRAAEQLAYEQDQAARAAVEAQRQAEEAARLAEQARRQTEMEAMPQGDADAMVAAAAAQLAAEKAARRARMEEMARLGLI
ncbi:filamentous hemagglutinin N-terminal domain-containing protein [Amantichitinum ursilacus]|uniref:Filamentous hemagglutinin n=1 Tax=Amantichitinum ursilacus TaxID=857265 RepID=A0A0N0GP83_9NEIS|nr:filamentous hemagglutinin N-terminal domain-containing protein [Amantichitinum ursilacus]KPC53244.1 Filamentous hemagglutinin [Amantichitinum ursilacus]